jgi:hypothetical protein
MEVLPKQNKYSRTYAVILGQFLTIDSIEQ